MPAPGPWTPAEATKRINQIAWDDCFALTLTLHAEDQMEERGLTTIDVLYVLKNGFVYDIAEKSTRPGYFRYAVISPTPNSNRRQVKVIAIPSMQSPAAKIVTVMWADDPMVGG